MLDQVTATRYVAPLREGGSLPGLMEADDLGTYVVKYTGAGQGPKVLVAEVIVGRLAEALAIPTPRMVVVDVPSVIARYEADEEVQDLLNASPGLNLGTDFLPGSFGYDASVTPEPDLAARIMWLDAYTANIDRTWANPNLLLWHRRVWAIDHGAALFFHHSWPTKPADPQKFATRAVDLDGHVLARVASSVSDQTPLCTEQLTDEVIEAAVADVPDAWLEPSVAYPSIEATRAGYVEHLVLRRDEVNAWGGGLP